MSLLLEVAQIAGVSPATVSRALNPHNTHPVNMETRARVLAASQQLDFRPNQLARGLKAKRTRTIGLIVHDVRDPYFSECARGASDAALDANFLTLICNTDRDPATELRYVQMLRESRTSALLFIGGGLETASYRKRLSKEISAIHDYGGTAVALGPRSDRWPADLPDNKGGAQRATEHLIGLGHERIALIEGPPKVKTSHDRAAGYRRALAEAGLPFDPSIVRPGGFSAEGGAAAISHLLDTGGRFTAVFATNDLMAIGCLQQLKARGLKVPDEISLVGFDDIEMVNWLDPPLTTIRVPMRELGAAGVRRALGTIEPEHYGPVSTSPRVNFHPTTLRVRASTAAPPRRNA